MDTIFKVIIVFCSIAGANAKKLPVQVHQDTAHEPMSNVVNVLFETVERMGTDMTAMKNQIHDLQTVNENLHRRIAKQEKINLEQERTMKSYKLMIEKLKTDADSQNNVIDDLKEMSQGQQEGLSHLEQSIANQSKSVQKELNSMVHMMDGIKSPGEPEEQYEHTSFGCFADDIALSCLDGGTINVTSAVYGMYADTCTDQCCAPHPVDDCTELVAENTPQDWVALKVACDHKTSCAFEYTGSNIDDCQEGYLADYMQIYYNCLPDDVNSPVAFSVYAFDFRTYNPSDILVFEGVISNFGNHFQPTTSTFHCPFHGVYVFSINFNAAETYDMHISIMRDDVDLAGGLAYSSQTRDHASALVIEECNIGQVVWARATVYGRMVGGSARSSHFSGYLLYKY